MGLLRRRCILRNYMNSRLLIKILVFADSGKCCMVSRKNASYTRIDSYITSLGFTKSEADENLYHILVEGKLLIILLYVDDLTLTSDEKLIKS